MTIKIPLQELVDLLGFDPTKDIEAQIKKTYRDVDVSVNVDMVVITIDDIYTLSVEVYQHLIKLCNRGQFDKALKKAQNIYPDYKLSSALNRIIGQIYFMTSQLNISEDYLIEALRLNPKNNSALILMGNLYYQKKDLDTALKYWHTALRYNSDDYLSLSNIGSSLAKAGEYQEAKAFFEQAIAVNDQFPNTYLGLGLIAYHQEEFATSFDYATQTLLLLKEKNEVYHNALNLGIKSAKELTKDRVGVLENAVKDLKTKLEDISGKTIDTKNDENLAEPAKIVIAEYHQKDKHQLLYKNEDITVSHLMLHELYHLKLVCDARANDQNFLFTSDIKHQNQFKNSFANYRQKMLNKGLPGQQVENLLLSLFHGMNSQIYNTAIDLFIEDLVYKQHPDVRMVQFLSLYNLVHKGIEATTHERIVNSLPSQLISKSKILNLVNALHFKDIYGVDLLSEFKASKLEISQAETFFEEFKEYRNDKAPGEEYEIIQHWAKDLKMHHNFKLVKERTTVNKTADDVLDEVNRDPYGLDSPEPDEQVNARTQFIEAHSTKDTNKAVAFYMMSALEYFKDKPQDTVKSTAMEFAALGMAGIDPKKKNYEVPSIPKKMTGYQALAYYYVSWAIGIPEMLSQLGMPFDKEYELAREMVG